jgi:hypothetical protein
VLEDKLADYLATVHGARTCLGLTALHRESGNQLPHLRTLYRYHHSFRGRFAYFPIFRLEGLGLVHLHLFVTQPDPRWARLPYAVESQWCTKNLVDPVLYLHCLVPARHKERLEQFLVQLSLSRQDLQVVWSGSPWQDLRLGHGDAFSQEFPLPHVPTVAVEPLARELLFAIPVLTETWNQQLSLTQLWQRIHARLGDDVRRYLPTRRFYPVNGKRHVKVVLRTLLQMGAFRQYVLRFPTDCRLLLLAPTYERSLPSALRRTTRSAELFPTLNRGALWRLAGSHDLFGARSSLAASSIFLVEQHAPPPVRFCYEWLLDPDKRQWEFSEERLTAHMQGVMA